MAFKWRKKSAAPDRAERPARSHGPTDLGALPRVDADDQGLAGVDVGVIGAYVGLAVDHVAPLSQLGGESTGLVGSKIRDKLRERGFEAEGLEPGELIAGQNRAREERMRAEGMSEEMIAMIKAKIGEQVAAHRHHGWTVVFANGNCASVQLFADGSDDAGEFGRLADRFRTERTRSGIESAQDEVLHFSVKKIASSPYEAYFLPPGMLAAKGREHEAVAKTALLGTDDPGATLAALAALALRSVEG